MSELPFESQKILNILTSNLSNIVPGNMDTYHGYKEIHDKLELTLIGSTYGDSLSAQGLGKLAEWTLNKNHPAITGLVIDLTTKMPGKGYFNLFNKNEFDFNWWKEQVELSINYDWSPYIAKINKIENPKAKDVSEPTSRSEVVINRIFRDTYLSKKVKRLNGYKCQICDSTITLNNGDYYCEAHHLKPLGNPYNGPDIINNIIIVCPNHHAELDYGVLKMEPNILMAKSAHEIGIEYINFHNNEIYGKT